MFKYNHTSINNLIETIFKMPKREKYIEWKTLSIPNVYYDMIDGYLRNSRRYTSVPEFVRAFMDSELKNFIENQEEEHKN